MLFAAIISILVANGIADSNVDSALLALNERVRSRDGGLISWRGLARAGGIGRVESIGIIAGAGILTEKQQPQHIQDKCYDEGADEKHDIHKIYPCQQNRPGQKKRSAQERCQILFCDQINRFLIVGKFCLR